MRRTPAIDIYRDTRGEWRWRLQAANGRIIADSGEGYRDRRGVMRAIEALRRAAAWAVCREPVAST